MSGLKSRVIDEVQKIPGVEARHSAVAGGSAFFYLGKEFAHFHDDNELDLRLTKKVIKTQGLTHPSGSLHHPNRSPNSPWIEIRFHESADVDYVVRLVRLAVAGL